MDGAAAISEGKVAVHVIVIERIKTTGNGPRYRALYGDEEIVASSRGPELDACRALLARGLTGKAVTIRKGIGIPAMRLDIEKAARLRTNENATVTARFGLWAPYPTGTTAADAKE